MPDINTKYYLKIPSQTDNLELIREFVSKVAEKVGFGDDDINKIELAIDEACTNVVKHAYDDKKNNSIGIAIKLDYDRFIVIVTDTGKGFDVNKIKTPDMKEYLAEMRVGGLGLYLIHSLMDEVHFDLNPGIKNEVQMVKYFYKKENNEVKIEDDASAT
ncbi:ATP-binding protein [candidate division KSB1 bacterium]|nr:ATP-binding protein [candidate division KSB1 bacterium]